MPVDFFGDMRCIGPHLIAASIAFSNRSHAPGSVSISSNFRFLGDFVTPTYTSPADQNFFAAIGRLAISWAHLEFGLDCIVEIVHYGFDGEEIEPEIPRALQRKITYLRAAFKKLPIGEEAVQGYMNLFDKIETAAQTRHDIIHGIVIDHAECSGEAAMVRVIRHKKGVTKKRFKSTTQDILTAARNAQKLGSKVFYWVNEFHALLEKLSQRHDAQKRS